MSVAAPPLLDPKPVLVAGAPEDADGFILNAEKVLVPCAAAGAAFPNTGATDGAPATVIVDAGIAGLPKIPPAVDVEVVDPPPKPPKPPKLDATSATGGLAASSSFFANADEVDGTSDDGVIFGVSGGAEDGAVVSSSSSSSSSFFFVGAVVASDPKLNAVFSEFAFAAARCNGGGEDGMDSFCFSFSLSLSFNSSTDPNAFDFGTLVAIEAPSGFTAGAGAMDANVTGAEAIGEVVSSFFSFFSSFSPFSFSDCSLAMPKLNAGLLSPSPLVEDGAKLNADFGFSSFSIASWIFA